MDPSSRQQGAADDDGHKPPPQPPARDGDQDARIVGAPGPQQQQQPQKTRRQEGDGSSSPSPPSLVAAPSASSSPSPGGAAPPRPKASPLHSGAEHAMAGAAGDMDSQRPRSLPLDGARSEGILPSSNSFRFQAPRLPHRSGRNMPQAKGPAQPGSRANLRPPPLVLPPSSPSKDSDSQGGGGGGGTATIFDVHSTPSLLQFVQELQTPPVTPKGSPIAADDASLAGKSRGRGSSVGAGGGDRSSQVGALQTGTAPSECALAGPRGGKGPSKAQARGFRKQYAPLTECGFGVYHRLRLPAILLVDSIEWDAWILVMVLFNALCLAFFRPTDASYSSLSLTIQFFEILCQICFTYEAGVKLAALGVVRYKLSYFRDAWNVFDFVVLVAGWLALYAFFTTISDDTSTLHGPLTVFGVIRVLRPLRVLKMLPELRRLTGAVLLALPQLVTLASLALLVFTTLVVVGLQLLGGKLHQQCYKPIGGFYEDTGPVLKLCSTGNGADGGRTCPDGYVCRASPSAPNYGFTSFDSVRLAYLTIFQCMTQQGWSDIMYWAKQVAGQYTYAYFTVILFLSFFLFNLIIVFIIVNYSLSQEKTAFESINKQDGKLVPQRSGVGGGQHGRSSVSGPSGLSSSTSSSSSSDYSDLLISKLLAMKAGAKLGLLTENAAAVAATAAATEGSDESATGVVSQQQQQQQQQQPDARVSSRIVEVALLLQRALRHLQLAPQNTLKPRYFRLPRGPRRGDESDSDSDDDEHDAGAAGPAGGPVAAKQRLLKHGGHGRHGGGLRKDPARVTYEESPGTYICASLARSAAFHHFMDLMTVVSTVLLSLAHYGMAASTADTLSKLNNAVVVVFTLEALIKIRGLGWRRFKADGMSSVDLLVVVVSILELFLGTDSAKSSALRCVRLLRVFSITRDWVAFRRVLSNMAYTASNSLPFLLLTTIFLFVFAIGGMTFLGGKLKEVDPVTGLEVPMRPNFDTFYWAVISVFQIMTLDQWNENMYEAMAAADDAIAAIFYVSAVLLGKYMLLNLLVAILVENYSSLQGDEGDRRRLLEDRLRAQGSFFRSIKAPFAFLRRCCLLGPRPDERAVVRRLSTDGGRLGAGGLVDPTASERRRSKSIWAAVQQLTRGSVVLRPSSFLRVESLPSTRTIAAGDAEGAGVKGAAGAAHDPPPSGAGGGMPAPALAPSRSWELEDEARGDGDDDSRRHSSTANALCQRCYLGCGRRLRVLDEALLGLYEHDWFPFAMIVVIMASCVILALDGPGHNGTGPSSVFRVAVQAGEALFICAMTFEQVYRVKSLGGVWTYDGSYLTRLWDWFDLLVVLSSLVALCIPYPSAAAVSANAPIAQALMAAKVARGFRPITLIPRINGLTVVVDTLAQALRACSGVLSVLAVFYLLFGILGVSLFGGGFHSCNDTERTCFPYTPPALKGPVAAAGGAATTGSTGAATGLSGGGFTCPLTQACEGRYYDVATASMVNREWENPTFSPEGSPYSFDSLPAALLTLFEVAFLEMWGEIMFTACDVVGPGRGPVRNANPGAAMYFLCFLFIVCFFVQEIFVAVIIDNFKRLRSISNGSAFMTAQQREWVRLQRTIKSRQPRIRAGPSRDQCLRYQAYRLVMHRYFEPCVVVVVALNVVGMLTYHYPQSPAWVRAQWMIDSVFTFVYLAEAALRIVAHGVHGYLTGAVSLWHPYDAVVATWGLLVFCLGPIAQASVFCLVALRLGRTLRLFRVIRHSSHLERLCRTFYFSLPSLKNIGMFLLLIYYIYAVGGMHLFSTLPRGTYINEDANFDSFGLALLTLVRCTTGEAWNGLMHEADQATAETRGKMAILYFCSFMILISYVVLNLFIATMIDNFQEDMASVGSVVTTKHIRRFSQLWTELKTKSLHGDLTKINNRAAHVATPATRKPAVHFLPAVPAVTAHPTDRESVGAMDSRRASTLQAAPSRLSFRRISIRERLGGAVRSVSSGKILSAAVAVTRQKKAQRPAGSLADDPSREEDRDGDAGAQRFSMARYGRAQQHTELGEEEQGLVFRRLYESSPRYLPIQYLKAFVMGLPAPLGPKGCFGAKALRAARVLEYIRSLEVPVNQYGYVYYQDVLQAVLRRAFELQTQIPQAMRTPFKNKRVFLAHEWYAAVAVQSVWRGRVLRSKLTTGAEASSGHGRGPRRASSPHRQQLSPVRKSSAASVAGLGASALGSGHLRISIGGSAGTNDALGWGGPIASGTGGTMRAGSPINGSTTTNKRASPKAIVVDAPPFGEPPPLSPITLPPPPVSPSHHHRRLTSLSLSRASRTSSVASVAEVSTPRARDSTSREAAPSVVLDNSRRRARSHIEVGGVDQQQQQGGQEKSEKTEADQEEVLAKMLALAILGDQLLQAGPVPLMGEKAVAAEGEEVDLVMEMLQQQGQEQGQVDDLDLAASEAARPGQEEEEALPLGDDAPEIRRRAESV